MLYITPLHDGARDCLDDIIASVAIWSNRDYELMYSKAWSFLYEPSQSDVDPLGNSIKLDHYDKYALLEKYHGIKLEFYPKESPEHVLSIIHNELSKNLPVAIRINAFWCPTCPGYHLKETQDMHFCLVVGLDTDNTLHYVDPYNMKYNASLTMNEFIQGYNGHFTFCLSTPEELEFDWLTIINSTISRLKNTSPSMIRDFSDHIRRSLDRTLEEGTPSTELYNFPLIQKLINISKDRRQFCIVLDYIANKYNVPTLVDSSSKLKNVSLKWDMVRALLCKYFLIKNLSIELRNKIADKIRDIANDEEYIVNNLLQFQSLSNKKFRENSKQILSPVLSNITFIDLKSYFNNKSFCGLSHYNGIADFTGDGRFFLMDDISNDYIWDVDVMKFDVTNITQNLNDNILSTSQIINTPNERYKALMILGSSDFSHMIDKLKIRYTDGSEDEIELGLSFFRTLDPFFHETLAYSGRFGTIINGNVTPLSYNGNIYSQIYTLRYDQALDSICLPYCPNMHIYAISLGK